MQMSVKQWRKLDVAQRIERGELTVSEAATALGMSRRQMQRLRKKVRQEGHAGVVHGNVGRAPKHKTAALVAQRIVALWRSKYVGFNDQHFTEKLREMEGLAISRETVRRILRGAGFGPARHRRSQKHRRRRDRRPQAGQMILWDGSRHDWLEGRGPPLCLMGAIDDATGELLPGAHFVDQECSTGYLRVLRDIVLEKGVPLSAYMDRHGSNRRGEQRPGDLSLRTQRPIRDRAVGDQSGLALMPKRSLGRGDLRAPTYAGRPQQQHGANWTADHRHPAAAWTRHLREEPRAGAPSPDRTVPRVLRRASHRESQREATRRKPRLSSATCEMAKAANQT
jgi:transposase